MKIEVKEYRKGRYAIYDENGKMIDDANGYGYRAKRNAYAAYAYKTRDKSKDAEKFARKRKIIEWLKAHRDFVNEFDYTIFQSFKDRENLTPTEVVKQIIGRYGEVEFKAVEIARVLERWDS